MAPSSTPRARSLPALRRALDRPQPVPGLASRSPVEGLAQRSVGFFDILAQSLAAVAPTGVAVSFPVIVMSRTGGPTLLVAVIAIIATLLVAVSINEFAQRIAGTGSLYTYVSKALGPGVGFLCAAALQLGYGFISIFALASSAEYLRSFLGVWRSTSPAAWLIAVLVLCLGTAVVALIARGIRITLRILLIIEVCTAAVVALLAGALLIHLRADIGWSMFELSTATPGNIGAGVGIVMTAFVGFESSAALGAEARRPFAHIPRALVWTVLGAGSLFLVAAASQVVGLTALGATGASTPSPIRQLTQAFAAEWVAGLLDLSVAVSFFACAAASCTALIRVIFSLGREGVFPASLGRTHSRLRTPAAAAIVTIPVIVLLPVGLLFAGADLSRVIDTSLVVATVGYLLAYLLVAVAVPVFLRRIEELTVRPILCAATAAFILAVVIGFYLSHEWSTDGRTGLVIAGLGLLLGAVYYRLRVVPRPTIRGRIGLYDEPLASDVLHSVTPPPETPTAQQ